MARHSSYRSTEHTRTGAITAFGSRTDVGCVREQNEDSLIVKPPLFVVADGMGGHESGEIASEICVTTIEECAPKHADVEELGKAVEQANREIINASLSGEGSEGMGTTCTATMLEGERLVIAQVGDSRAYLMHAGRLAQLTRDHSLMANMIEAGQISPEEARSHPNRSVITRALGSDPDTVPDLYEINVEAGDRLLVCSDGLTAMVTDERIEEIMNRVADPQRCAAALVNEAISAGGADNVTVIVANATGAAEAKQGKLRRNTALTIVILALLLAAIIGATVWGGSAYLHNSAYLAEDNGKVAVYRGVPGDVLGFTYSEHIETTDIDIGDLAPSAAASIREGMRVGSVDEAEQLVESYRLDIEAQAKNASGQSSGAAGSAESAAASASSNASSSTASGAAAASSGASSSTAADASAAAASSAAASGASADASSAGSDASASSGEAKKESGQ